MAITTTIEYTRVLSSVNTGDAILRTASPLKRDCGTCQDANENCPACTNDLPFYRFVKCDQSLHLQLNFIDEWNTDPLNPDDGWLDGWLGISLVTPTTVIPVTDMLQIASEWMVGATAEGLTYQNLVIDMTKTCSLIGNENCFYFKFSNCKPGYSEPDYVAERCANLAGLPPNTTTLPIGFLYFDNSNSWNLWQWDGATWNLVTVTAGQVVYCSLTGVFYEKSGDSYIVVDNPFENPDPDNPDCTDCYSELFRVQLCEELVEFSADWAEFDCEGFFHGLADEFVGSSNFAYNPTFTVKANIETIAFPIEEEKTDEGTTVRLTQSERALMRSWGMPQSAVKSIANYLMQRPFYINSEVWDSATAPEKNNDNGSHWWIELTFEREICDRKTFACD